MESWLLSWWEESKQTKFHIWEHRHLSKPLAEKQSSDASRAAILSYPLLQRHNKSKWTQSHTEPYNGGCGWQCKNCKNVSSFSLLSSERPVLLLVFLNLTDSFWAMLPCSYIWAAHSACATLESHITAPTSGGKQEVWNNHCLSTCNPADIPIRHIQQTQSV